MRIRGWGVLSSQGSNANLHLIGGRGATRLKCSPKVQQKASAPCPKANQNDEFKGATPYPDVSFERRAIVADRDVAEPTMPQYY